jgi:hypothetical protein
MMKKAMAGWKNVILWKKFKSERNDSGKNVQST